MVSGAGNSLLGASYFSAAGFPLPTMELIYGVLEGATQFGVEHLHAENAGTLCVYRYWEDNVENMTGLEGKQAGH